MLEISSFDSVLGGQVRFVSVEGKQYASGSDCAKSLGFSSAAPAVITHVWKEYRFKFNAEKSVGSPGWWLNEHGVNQLLFSSDHPKAVEFQRWIFEEVLPAIRRDGAYIDERRITDPQLAKVSNRIKQMQQERIAARKSWTDQIKNRLIKDGLYHTTNGAGKSVTTAYSKNVFRSLTVEVNEILFNRRHFYCDRSAFMGVDQQEIITQFEIELAATAREYPDEPIEKIVALALDKIVDAKQT